LNVYGKPEEVDSFMARTNAQLDEIFSREADKYLTGTAKDTEFTLKVYYASDAYDEPVLAVNGNTLHTGVDRFARSFLEVFENDFPSLQFSVKGTARGKVYVADSSGAIGASRNSLRRFTVKPTGSLLLCEYSDIVANLLNGTPDGWKYISGSFHCFDPDGATLEFSFGPLSGEPERTLLKIKEKPDMFVLKLKGDLKYKCRNFYLENFRCKASTFEDGKRVTRSDPWRRLFCFVRLFG
jgi:hypothetical protein